MSRETPLLLLRVAATWALPGLGLLALADGPTPYLAACALHTALAVEVWLPDGTRHPNAPTYDTGPPATEFSHPAVFADQATDETEVTVEDVSHETEDDDSLSLDKKEKELIVKALRRNNNKRKYAAQALGISERTLYRKIKQYEIEEE